MHNMIRYGSVPVLKRILTTANVILSQSHVFTEHHNLIPTNLGLKLFDASYFPDPSLTEPTIPQCPYGEIGVDCINAPPHQPITSFSTDAQQNYTAAAELNLQNTEQGKLARQGHNNPNTHHFLKGNEIILIQLNWKIS